MIDIGVPLYEPSAARSNVVALISGEDKGGKTLFALMSDGPRYLMFLDRNASIHETIAEAAVRGYASPLYPLILPPIDAEAIDGAFASKRLGEVAAFAEKCRMAAAVERAAGRPGGTFILDGGRVLKGLLEKERFNFSATLGDRAKPGQNCTIHEIGCTGKKSGCIRVPVQIQYGETNGALQNFIARFAGAACDAIFIFEGREEWVDAVNEEGHPTSRPTGRWESTAPKPVGFVVTINLTLAARTVPVPGTMLTKTVHTVTIGKNAYDSALRGEEGPAEGFAVLRKRLIKEG